MMNQNLNCEEVDELAGAYALEALDADEMSAVDAHLAGCDKHAHIAQLVATARALPLAVPEREPPPELKSRLMAVVNADLAAETAGAAPELAPAITPPAAEPQRGWLSRLFGSPALGWGLAGAMAIVVAALLIAGPLTGDDDGETLVRSFESDGVSGEVIYIPDEETAVMTVDGLEPAAEGETYQVWAVSSGEDPVSIGFLEGGGAEPSSSAMSVSLSEGQTVAVTVEPEGGSPQPTTEPILSVEI